MIMKSYEIYSWAAYTLSFILLLGLLVNAFQKNRKIKHEIFSQDE